MSKQNDSFDSDADFLNELLDLDDQPSTSYQRQPQKVAEVGMEELNSLADLFENEDAEWEQSWQNNQQDLPQPKSDEDWLGLRDGDQEDLVSLSDQSSQNNGKRQKDEVDFESLFGEDLTPEPRNGSNTEKNPEDNLPGLFAAELSFTETKQQSSSQNKKLQVQETTSELDDLFSDSHPPQTSKIVTQTQSSPPKLPLEIIYYNGFSEIKALLKEPVTVTAEKSQIEEIFSSLEALLNKSPLASQPKTQAEDQTQRNPEKRTSPTPSTTKEDDDFSELEELLEQVDRNLGGVSTATNQASKARPARARIPKAQIFDQTMRVPVKQLDNLSNLVGELVVNRNSLEQEQERLRQFLDNLLHQVQNLSDVGARMEDLYERSLLENALLASRQNSSVNRGSRSNNKTVSNHNTRGDYNPLEEYDPLQMDSFTKFHLLAQEMIELIVRVRESSSDIEFLVDETDQVARNLRQVTTQVQEGLNKTRMIPFAQTADRLPRAIREISLKLGKQAELDVKGRDTLIDKMLVEHLYDPMTHLINNAITHGIESPKVREKANKSTTGKISIQAFHHGPQTVISVSDDGAGIDPDRVKAKAIEKGLITSSEARALNDTEVYEFLFNPGFSTKDKADDFSGRGVGMDVVRTSLSEIRGTVSVDSTLGKGTTFTIRLPLTLSIGKALCCSSENTQIAFPMDGVEDMRDIHPQEMKENSEGMSCVEWREGLLPCYRLSELLSYNRRVGRSGVYASKGEDNLISVVILRSVGNYLAVEVDAVLGEQEIVIKQFQGPIPKPSGIAGATVLGDGRVMAIADVLELIEISQGKKSKESGGGSLWQTTAVIEEASQQTSEPLVLIVDDSITVRELLSMTFNKSGYRVEQARDGQEAWDKIRAGLPCDLVFCDIEMPRMDGLELLSRLQGDEKYQHIPVALLTSRGAARHRQIAAQQGARGYFTKPYLEEMLIDSAHRMLRGEDLLNGGKDKDNKKDQPKPKSEVRLLIIDDSVTVRELLSMTFRKSGYQVEQARDGQEAWKKLHESTYDLVFCDIEMPRMDGLELLKQIQEEGLESPPIAMLTSRGAERHRKVAAQRGASGYFTKPYLEEDLLEAAEKMIAGEVLLANSVRKAVKVKA